VNKTSDGQIFEVKQGEVVVELFKQWHKAFNPSDTEEAELIVFFYGDISKYDIAQMKSDKQEYLREIEDLKSDAPQPQKAAEL